MRQSGAHIAWVCLTQFVPLTSSLNFLAVYFSRRLTALFHAVTPLGFLPFRAFPPHPVGPPFQGPLPSCRWLPRTARLQGLDPDADPLLRCTIFRHQRNPLLSWAFIPSRACALSRWNSNEFLLPWPCPPMTRRSIGEWPTEYRSAKEPVQLSRVGHTLVGFFASTSLHDP